MPILFEAAHALLVVAAVSCTPEPTAMARVVGAVDPITVGNAFTLRQLEDLSRRAAGPPRHRPLGFYYSETRDVVSVKVDEAPPDGCAGAVSVEVTIRLTNRHIQIASDLQAEMCRTRAATDHYRLHADADAAIIGQYIPILTEAFAKAPLPEIIGALGDPRDNQGRIAGAVKSIATPVLAQMVAAQASAIDSVDSDDEVRKLESVCGGGI